MKKTKTKLLAVLLTAAMGALTACGGSGSSETTAAASGESQAAETTAAVELAEGESVSQDTDITAAMLVDFTTMDPMDTSDTLSGGIQRLMMDGLFGFDDDMKIIPMLATDYEANDDATEFTIHLREGIQFSDGTPWNAEAAKANFDRWGDKNLGLKMCIRDRYYNRCGLPQYHSSCTQTLYISAIPEPHCIQGGAGRRGKAV